MRSCAFALCLTLLAGAAAFAQRETTFRAGPIDTHADVYETSVGKAAPIILLFHQGGGDARGEYGPIIPRLVAQNFNVMAVDTRGGGTRFGGRNRAAATDSTFRYCDALAEVEGAVDAARRQGFSGPLVLWGSSYTAALVMQVALRRSTEVRAVLAFSPASGPPMAGCEPEGIAAELDAQWRARAGGAGPAGNDGRTGDRPAERVSCGRCARVHCRARSAWLVHPGRGACTGGCGTALEPRTRIPGQGARVRLGEISVCSA